MRLSELAASAAARTGTVILGGASVPVRVLSIAETGVIAASKPRPSPQYGYEVDPNLGQSRRVEKRTPDFERAEREWAEWMQCAEVAAAAGIQAENGDAFPGAAAGPERVRAWAEPVVAAMRAALSWKELAEAARAIEALSCAEARVPDAVKN